jgi:hypothetical protein
MHRLSRVSSDWVSLMGTDGWSTRSCSVPDLDSSTVSCRWISVESEIPSGVSAVAYLAERPWSLKLTRSSNRLRGISHNGI